MKPMKRAANYSVQKTKMTKIILSKRISILRGEAVLIREICMLKLWSCGGHTAGGILPVELRLNLNNC